MIGRGRATTWIFATLAVVSIIGGGWWAYNAALQAVLDGFVKAGLERSLNKAGTDPAPGAPSGTGPTGSALPDSAPSANHDSKAPTSETAMAVGAEAEAPAQAPGPDPKARTRELGKATLLVRVSSREPEAPVPGVPIELRKVEVEMGSRRGVAAVQSYTMGDEDEAALYSDMGTATDSRGEVRFGPLPAGHWQISVSGDAWAGSEQMIEVPDEAKEILIELEAIPGLFIEGRVRDESGAGQAEAFVSASQSYVVYGGAARRPPLGLNAHARTDPDGRFRVGPLGSGEFELRASKPPFVAAELEGIPAGATGVDLVLAKGARIFGKVLDPEGKPWEGRFSIQLMPDGDFHRGTGSEIKLHKHGGFEVLGVGPGPYSLHGTAEGYLAGSAEFEVRGREELGPIEVRLRTGGAIAGRVVKGRGGPPIAGATVRLADEPQSMQEAMQENRGFGTLSERSVKPVTTGEDGRFLLEGVMPGKHRIRLSHPKAAPRLVAGIEVEEGGTVDLGDLGLGRGCMIQGHVSGRGGQPPAGDLVVNASGSGGMGMFGVMVASVEDEVSGEDRDELPEGMARLDANGDYRIDGLAPGTYTVMVLDRSGMQAGASDPEMNLLRQKKVSLVAGEFARVDFQYGAGTVVRGSVLDRGQPVPAAQVVVVKASGQLEFMSGMAMSKVDAQGNFRVEDVPAGDYAAMVSLTGDMPSYSRRFSVPEGAAEVVLDLSVPTGAVFGRVSLDDGSPAKNADIMLESAEERPEAKGMLAILEKLGSATNAKDDGRFKMTGVGPGRYVLKVKQDGYALLRSAEFELAQDQTVGPFELVLSRGLSLSGVVRNAAGKPLPGVSVWMLDSKATLDAFLVNQGGPIQTDKDGRFALDGLKPGNYDFTLRRAGYATLTLQDMAVGPAAPPPLELVLTVGGRVQLTLHDRATGEPAAGAVLELASADRPEKTSFDPMEALFFGGSMKRTTEQDGEASWEHVPAGVWIVLLIPADEGAEPVELGRVQVHEEQTSEASYQR